ncbi:hypothetical protein D9Z41_24370 [Salmonella enterica]|nr:hypothetical protein [Salmonella enterica]
MFCEVRQGGGAYGKSASGAAFPGVSFFAHMFFPGLSPGSVDNRVSVLRKESPLAAAERPSVASQ